MAAERASREWLDQRVEESRGRPDGEDRGCVERDDLTLRLVDLPDVLTDQAALVVARHGQDRAVEPGLPEERKRVLRLSPDYGSGFSLWDEEGAVDRATGRALGLSAGLLDQLEGWTAEWESLYVDLGDDRSVAQQILEAGPGRRHRAEGEALFARLCAELDPTYTAELDY